MKNFCKKYKIQMVLAGYFLILGIFIYGGIFMMVKNIKEKADEIQKKIIDSEIDEKNLARIPQLMEDYETFSSKESNLNVILPEESEIEFIKSLEDLAKETGNTISLKLIKEENKDGQSKAKTKEKNKEDIESNLPYENYITIQLELEGKYPELMSFLGKIENMGYYANVTYLNLKKEEKKIEIKSDNPFVGPDGASAPKEVEKEEVLKSLINLIVYVRR